MNPVIEQMLKHRSIRKFKKKEVSEEILKTIIEAGTMASSSGNMQAYTVIVTRDDSLKKKMEKAHFHQPMLMEAPLFLTFCADFHRMRNWLKLSDAPDNFDNFMSFMIASIDSILVSQNVALAAESLGLGLCYMGTTLASAQEIGRILELPENVVPVVGFALGYPDEAPEERKRLPLKAILHREKYQKISEETLLDLYKEKEENGMKRYRSNPEMFRKIDKLNAKNLAQVYTKVKYSKHSHMTYSGNLLSFLKKQKFIDDSFFP